MDKTKVLSQIASIKVGGYQLADDPNIRPSNENPNVGRADLSDGRTFNFSLTKPEAIQMIEDSLDNEGKFDKSANFWNDDAGNLWLSKQGGGNVKFSG